MGAVPGDACGVGVHGGGVFPGGVGEFGKIPAGSFTVETTIVVDAAGCVGGVYAAAYTLNLPYGVTLFSKAGIENTHGVQVIANAFPVHALPIIA